MSILRFEIDDDHGLLWLSQADIDQALRAGAVYVAHAEQGLIVTITQEQRSPEALYTINFSHYDGTNFGAVFTYAGEIASLPAPCVRYLRASARHLVLTDIGITLAGV